MTFFKTFLAALLAILATVFLVFILGGVIIGGIVASADTNEAVKIEENSILHLRLNGEIVENAVPDDFGFEQYIPMAGFDVDSKIGLYQLVEAIRAAKKDENIKGIYLNTNGAVTGGWATLKTIYDELLEFKKSGKFIYAYAEVYSEKSYYLSTTADKLFMPPSGMLEFNGFAAQPMFYTG
ncbi:MAG: S49 family peptidase, partial [Bacteroidia bacterium]